MKQRSKYILIVYLISTSLMAVAQVSDILESLHLKVGMKRSELESRVSQQVKFNTTYSAQYPMESSTKATYRLGKYNLMVIYKEGAPAPYVIDAEGRTVHEQAIEQTVLSWSVDE